MIAKWCPAFLAVGMLGSASVAQLPYPLEAGRVPRLAPVDLELLVLDRDAFANEFARVLELRNTPMPDVPRTGVRRRTVWQLHHDSFRICVTRGTADFGDEQRRVLHFRLIESARHALRAGNAFHLGVLERDLTACGVPAAVREQLLIELVGRQGFHVTDHVRLEGEKYVLNLECGGLAEIELFFQRARLNIRATPADEVVARLRQLATPEIGLWPPFVGELANHGARVLLAELEGREEQPPAPPNGPRAVTVSVSKLPLRSWPAVLSMREAAAEHEQRALGDGQSLSIDHAIPGGKPGSVAVRGLLSPAEAGLYRFTSRTDDPGFVLLNRCVLGNAWRRNGTTTTAEAVLDRRPYLLEAVSLAPDGNVRIEVSVERWSGRAWEMQTLELRPVPGLATLAR